MFFLKRKHKIKPLKGYVPVKGFYQELNILQTDSGFSKLFKIKDVNEIDKKSYEEKLLEYFLLFLDKVKGKNYKTKPFIQIYAYDNVNYILCNLDTRYVEDAEKIFLECEDQGLIVVPLDEWLSLIKAHFRMMDKIDSVKIGKKFYLRDLSPLPSNGIEEDKNNLFKALSLNNKYVKTVMIDSFPNILSHAFLTEVMKLGNVVSIFCNAVNEDICLAELKKGDLSLPEERITILQNELESKFLYNLQIYISIIEESEEDVKKKFIALKEKTASFLVEINGLNTQQNKAFRSASPLGKNYISSFKAISKEKILSFFPFSYQKHHETGVYYGKDEYWKDIYFDRLSTKLDGFLLSSNRETLLRTIKEECEFFLQKGKKVEIYTTQAIPELATFSSTEESGFLFSGVEEEDREILFYISRKLFGFQGQLKREDKEILNRIIDGLDSISFSDFKDKLKDESTTLYKRIEFISLKDEVVEKSNLDAVVHIIGEKSQASYEKFARMFSAIANSKADAVYILDGEELIGTRLLDLFFKKDFLLSICSLRSRETNGNKKMFDSTSFSKHIQAAPFFQIGYLDSQDRVSLNRVFSFNKKQKMSINNPSQNTGIYRFQDFIKTYHNAEKGVQID